MWPSIEWHAFDWTVRHDVICRPGQCHSQSRDGGHMGEVMDMLCWRAPMGVI